MPILEDHQIVALYWERTECAIEETDKKYRRMLYGISHSLLGSPEDAEECLNDTYLAAWNAMPTDRPQYLGAYLAKIIRRRSVSRYRSAHREKRGGIDRLTEELTECIPDSMTLQQEWESQRLGVLLHHFLAQQKDEKRRMFLRRYFYSQSVFEIAAAMGVSESKVKTTLFRMRAELKALLEQEELL